MRPTTELPDDPALPGLAAIRTVGLARAIPALGLGAGPFELRVCGYSPGERATLAVRVGDRRFAVKAYAEDPAPEAALYEALAAAGLAPSGPGTGLAHDSAARVPPLLAREPDRWMLVIGWLEGPPLTQLVKQGQGRRAGELAAAWLRRAATLPLRIGPSSGATRILGEVGEYVAMLEAGDPALGTAARELAARLARTQPMEGTPHLVHGTLYARHILDLGDGPGVIDWQRFGQGPLELDAGVFLATLTHSGLTHRQRTGEARRTEEAFLAATAGLLDERALAWHRSAHLLRMAGRMLRRQPLAKARVVLNEAVRLAEAPATFTLEGSPLELALEALSATLTGPALEFALRALSTRPATPEERAEIGRLLEEVKQRRR